VPPANQPPPDDSVALSGRQSEVLRLIAEGLTEIEIAEELGIAPRTVRMHADVLRIKLGVARRRQLPSAYRKLHGES
jgi:DNA-binding NarL/FixJ family response regulator